MTKPLNHAARGRIGARVFLQKVTAARRRAIARKAARARWRKTPKDQRQEAARKAVMARWARAKRRRRGTLPPDRIVRSVTVPPDSPTP